MAPLTAKQHAIRRAGIGASEIAALFDEDPWKTPLDVWATKTGRVEDGANFLTRMGNRAEEIIADEFAERHDVKLVRYHESVRLGDTIAVATPDRRLVKAKPLTLLECKNVGYRVLPRWRADSQTYITPPYVQIQGQWQCGVVKAGGFHVAAWIGGREWHEEHFDADPEMFANLLAFAEGWWRDHVVNDSQPDPGANERARTALEALFPASNKGTILPAPEEARPLIREFAAARADAKAARARMIAAGNRLCQMVGEADGIAADWGEVTWRAPKSGSVSWAKVARELGAPAGVIAKHTSAPRRRLKVTVLGAEEDDDDE